MLRPVSIPVLAGLLLSSIVPAQDDPFRFVPRESQLIVRAKGLEGMLEHMAGTEFGAVMARPEIRELLPDLLDLTPDIGFSSSADESQDDPISLELGRILSRHEGWMTLAMWIDPKVLEHPDPTYSGTQFFHIVLTIEPSAAVPLERLKGFCDQVEDRLELEGMEISDVDGLEGLRSVTQGDTRFVYPTIREGRLFCAYAVDPASTLAPLLLEGEHFEQDLSTEDRASALWLRLHPDMIRYYLDALTTPSELMGEEKDESQPTKRFSQRLGIEGLGPMTARIRPSDDRIVAEFEIRTDPGTLGLVDAILPVKLTTPPLLDLVDRTRPRWDASWLDWEQLFDVVEAATEATESLPPGHESLSAYVRSSVGIDLREDVLAKLDGQVLLLDPVDTLDAGMMPGLLEVFLSPGVTGIGCRDADGLRASLGKAVRSQGLHVQIEESDYRGHEVWDLSFFSPVQVGFGDRALWIGIGEGAESAVRSMLDAEIAVSEGTRFGDWPTSITTLRDALGWKASALRFGQTEPFLETYFPTKPLPILEWLRIGAFIGTPSEDFLESIDADYRARLEAEHAAYNRTATAARALIDALDEAELGTYLSGAQTEPARRIYRWVF